jgi:cytoplasmic iron level regulating protein YaaA (DUF328/UPF0246 family)
MLLVVSPAKNLDYESELATSTFTQPDMLDHAQELIIRCRELTPKDIGGLMKISDKLSDLNANRYQQWQLPFTPENARQAVLAFNGDVYSGLKAGEFSEEDFAFAQQHMRILSGLYGLLRPLDLMQAYRLEMGTKLSNHKGKDLYQYWGEVITCKLNTAMKAQGDNILVNLASNEYFKAVKPQSLEGVVITPIFKDWKNGEYKIISFYAKKARGMMARYIIQHRLTDVQQLYNFDSEGYKYTPDQSDQSQLVFQRKL